MNKPDTHPEECKHVLKDLLRFSRATARGDQEIARQAARHLEQSLEMLLDQMNSPDTQAEECKRVLRDLLKFFRATARGDQEIARQAAKRLEDSLKRLLERMRQTSGGS